MTDELFAKLKRLRRERDGAPAPRDAREGLPAWLRRRLARGSAAGPASPGAIAAPAPGVGLRPAAGQAPPRSKTLGPPRDLAPVANDRGVHAARVERLAPDARHGEWSLDEARGADPRELAWLAGDDALAELSAERALFLDIETTGLSGGAGTHVFLVGLARFERGALELWQGFASGPEEEAALLASVAERIATCGGLVTFFGKSFDRHRLQDKMRMHGVAPPFAGRAHLDLYHPLRRLYAGAFADGRLATLERELCGVTRVRDLPGSFAPAAWFDFVAGRPHLLEEVFRHNHDDVKSLVTLYAHLARTRAAGRAGGERLSGPAAARHAALARLAAKRRDFAAAEEWLARVPGPLPGDLARLRERLAARRPGGA